MSDDKRSRSEISSDLKEYKNYEEFTKRSRNKQQELYEEALWEANQLPDPKGEPFDKLYKIHGPGEYLQTTTNKKYKVTKFLNHYHYENEDRHTFGSFPGSCMEWKKK